MSDLASVTITRRQGKSEYEKLRAELLEHVQQFTATQWTDYNTHDPGVTILEQLAYGLSDINHRSDYPVDEFLSDRQSEVRLNEHGLFLPEQAFPCRPVSVRDLQKSILDSMPELAFVTARYSHDSPGLIQLKLSGRSSQLDEAKLKSDVDAAYQMQRNLCESLDSVEIVERTCVEMQGIVHLEDLADVHRVIISTYMDIQSFLLGDVRRFTTSSEVEKASDMNGPRLKRVPIKDADLDLVEQPRPMSALIKRLMAIPGVQAVENLQFFSTRNSQNPYCFDTNTGLPSAQDHVFFLDFKQQIVNEGIKFFYKGKHQKVDSARIYHELQSEISRKESGIGVAKHLVNSNVLKSNFPNLATVSSVQSQFPNNYGINSFGVPAGSDTLRKAQARQLQGYLLLFDQIMNDHLLLADSLKHLFSTKTDHVIAYPSSKVKDTNAYDIESLYLDIPSELSIPKALKTLDEDPEDVIRKIGVLDFLLAINGREPLGFADEHVNSLYSERELLNVGVVNRATALTTVHEYSENRGSGFNTHHKTWLTDNISTLEKFVRLILGVPAKRTSCLYRSLNLFCENLKTETSGAKPTWNSIHFQDISTDIIESRLPESAAAPQVALPEDLNKSAFSDFLQARKHNLGPYWGRLLQVASTVDRYTMCRLRNRKSVDLLVNIADTLEQPRWIYLASFKKLEECVNFANVMRHLFLQERLRIDGVHLVEHLLLLPKEERSVANQEDNSFYSNQMTLVFPAYSPRNQHLEFREYIENIVLSECPAHLYCHVLWLTHSQMQRFELLLSDWFKQLRQSDSDDEFNVTAHLLTEFLRDHELHSGSGYAEEVDA